MPSNHRTYAETLTVCNASHNPSLDHLVDRGIPHFRRWCSESTLDKIGINPSSEHGFPHSGVKLKQLRRKHTGKRTCMETDFSPVSYITLATSKKNYCCCAFAFHGYVGCHPPRGYDLRNIQSLVNTAPSIIHVKNISS